MVLLFLIGSVGSAIAGKPVRRTFDKDANGSYDWSCNETPDYVEITCFRSELCKICPESVQSTHCAQHSAYDPTDLLSMEELFQEVDRRIAKGEDSGQLRKSFWVENEQYPRNYIVNWKLVANQYQMEWQLIEGE